MEEKKKREKPPLIIPKTTTDFQRLKVERLMKDPSKPVIIPDRPKVRKVHEPPEFVRNVMGSSAGAGSGEFHVYRHLRRKEYSRQKFIEERARKERLEENFHKKIEQNKLEAEMRTAKKREKRLKKKMAKRQKKTKQPTKTVEEDPESSTEEESDTNIDDENQSTTAEMSIDIQENSCSTEARNEENNDLTEGATNREQVLCEDVDTKNDRCEAREENGEG